MKKLLIAIIVLAVVAVAVFVSQTVFKSEEPRSLQPAFVQECQKKKSAVLKEFQQTKRVDPVISTGQIIFPNKNYDVSSFTVASGFMDESHVNSDGTFCLVVDKSKPLSLILVGQKSLLLGAVLSLHRTDNQITITPESTAETVLAFSLSVETFFTDRSRGNKVARDTMLSTIQNGTPEIDTFTQAMTEKLLNTSPADTSFKPLDPGYLAESSELEPLYTRALDSIRDRVVEAIRQEDS